MSTAAAAKASDLQDRISSIIASAPVVLFMKGTPTSPQCGFSASVIEILGEHLEAYETFDVLSDADVRQGIKTFSDWPTIPQLYVDKTFVGGADIVAQMAASGELRTQLAATPGVRLREPVQVPDLSITDAAKDAVMASREPDDGDMLRLSVSPTKEHGLNFDATQAGDFKINVGPFTILVDPVSARYAQSIHIDYVTEGERQGFKIDNPAKSSTVAVDAPRMPPAMNHPPKVEVTSAAGAQFVAAIAEEEGSGPFGIRVTARRMGKDRAEYELDIVEEDHKPAGGFVVEKEGFDLWIDRLSARNLDGAKIDFVTTEQGAGFKFENESIKKGWDDPRAERFEQLLEEEINPGIAAHGGVVQLLDLQGDTAYVLMGGGCQGCGMAGVTLEQGIMDRVTQLIPSIVNVIDSTDHAAGANPYYKA